MMVHKLAARYRVHTESNGDDKKWILDPVSGGSMAKVAQVSVVIREQSSTAAQISFDLDQGPDGRNFAPHSQPIAQTTLDSGDAVLVGDADTSKILGQWLQGAIVVGSTGATEEWVDVDVYLMLKPF